VVGPARLHQPGLRTGVRPGGAWRIEMRGPDGAAHPAKGVYQEVVPPERLAFTIDHSELSEEWHDMVNPQRDRAAGKPRLEALVSVTFEEESGKTKLTVRMCFESAAVRDAFVKLGVSQGWSQSLERLEALLAAACASG
jgi:uncharacterized protein YndB with AHSA1/START domain